MQLLPSERVSVTSRSTPEELLARMAAATEPAVWLRNPFSREHKPFQGEIAGDRFKLTRIIHYRNSFLPTVVGTVRGDGSGAIIEATLRLNLVATGFMLVWFGGVTVGFFIFLASALMNGSAPVLALAPAALFLFGALLVHGGFRAEAGKARRFLEELAAGPATPPPV